MLHITSSQYIKPKAADITGDDACDYARIDSTRFIAVLCDGVGSARRGGTAARQTVKYFMEQFKRYPKTCDVRQSISVLTRDINHMLFDESMSHYKRAEYLTTLSLAVIDGETLYTTNLGDSHIYLQRGNAPLKLLSVDHTMDDNLMSHVLTKACGLNKHVDPEIRETILQPEDKVILCSDGVSNLISDDMLTEKVKKGLNAKLIVEDITRVYKDYERDDASLQIFSVNTFDERTTANSPDDSIERL